MKSPRLLYPFFYLLFVVSPTVAMEVIPLSIAELTEQSSLVLHGTVLSKSCQRDPAGRIYTKVELQIAEVWKGSLTTNRFTVVHGGGILGERRVVVSGQVEYGIGELVVAFLVLNPRGEGVTLGLMQGKFRVWKDAETGEELAQNPFHGTGTLSHSMGEGLGVEGPFAGSRARNAVAVRGVLTLAELKRRVQEAAR